MGVSHMGKRLSMKTTSPAAIGVDGTKRMLKRFKNKNIAVLFP
jgi:hypothetical protein